MPPSFLTAQCSLAIRWGWFQEGRFLGKVLDEWIADSQEFLRTKLPHLVVIVLIAFVLSRLLGLIAGFMALDVIGFNLAPLLASAGIAGVAIGLAAQNIVKDVFNGILILV